MQGGFSEVHLAHDKLTGKEVALKVVFLNKGGLTKDQVCLTLLAAAGWVGDVGSAAPNGSRIAEQAGICYAQSACRVQGAWPAQCLGARERCSMAQTKHCTEGSLPCHAVLGHAVVVLQKKILAGEARLVRMVAHPNVVRCMQVLETRRQQVRAPGADNSNSSCCAPQQKLQHRDLSCPVSYVRRGTTPCSFCSVQFNWRFPSHAACLT